MWDCLNKTQACNTTELNAFDSTVHSYCEKIPFPSAIPSFPNITASNATEDPSPGTTESISKLAWFGIGVVIGLVGTGAVLGPLFWWQSRRWRGGFQYIEKLRSAKLSHGCYQYPRVELPQLPGHGVPGEASGRVLKGIGSGENT
ncbi:hypothetical protein P152DRAFT_516714 [Eremomyces bilateralis CBS 781.70]|uniref:Uncharacterized protein n=1 Tax=Eremomyces bilateralis CBS 781.70 TaxID=1392243 RepID=A0A6G1FUW8_9PEZI|nr:uncharacterized protein P152DRAFT_516714 [Eremomyces bilateralis CBS 781.70]KAF1809553.1 hypothetical protein P152DRAFT_516714 [Eremomyces bilateralis CBS 781.70]